jgi:hypothetical protein
VDKVEKAIRTDARTEVAKRGLDPGAFIDFAKIRTDVKDTIFEYTPTNNALTVLMSKATERWQRNKEALKADNSISGRMVKHAHPELVADPVVLKPPPGHDVLTLLGRSDKGDGVKDGAPCPKYCPIIGPHYHYPAS